MRIRCDTSNIGGISDRDALGLEDGDEIIGLHLLDVAPELRPSENGAHLLQQPLGNDNVEGTACPADEDLCGCATWGDQT